MDYKVDTKLYDVGSSAVRGINGPLLFISGAYGCVYGELVRIVYGDDSVRWGQIIQIDKDVAVIQVFEGTMALQVPGVTVYFERDVVKVPISKDLIGRILDGRGRPKDDLPPVIPERYEPVVGKPINPALRKSPSLYIETGISTIDLLNTLLKGQKLPIFAGGGLPASEIAVQLVKQARSESSKFLIVFAGMGISFKEADFFMSEFKESGIRSKGIFFMNMADDPAVERLLTPRCALTVAEYFAFELGYDVLVILIDMLNYCDALREVSAAREEIPGRRGYPGYMYSDLATIYERAGCIRGKEGSITQVPILTMPADDMTHPVVDLTGYITEGQIVLSRTLNNRGIYPPVDVLPSLSRLMNKGIGKGKTFPEHRALADQLYSCYAMAVEIQRLVMIVGEEGLTEVERKYLEFGKAFEEKFINQGKRGRSLKESVEAAWECLRLLPKKELVKLPKHYVEQYYPGK